MNCLTDYIGIKSCADQVTPESGLFINSLPGVSLESIDKIATADQTTYLGVWADVQNEAFARFESDFLFELDKCFNLNPYCDYEALICNNKKKLIQPWKYLLGNQIMLYRLYSTRLNRFTTVDIKQAGELRDFYQAQYELTLQQAVKMCELGDCHLDCGGNPEVVTWLP